MLNAFVSQTGDRGVRLPPMGDGRVAPHDGVSRYYLAAGLRNRGSTA
ncbi:MAG: hypothetical protein AAGI71_17360 [Bacteroidota bacterium]